MTKTMASGLPYCVAFNTTDMPGKVVAVQVTLNTHIMGPQDKVRVDLVDHPLYAKLHAYCLANPPQHPEKLK